MVTARILPATAATVAWARAARAQGGRVLADPEQRNRWLRHGGTWFVGVDALSNGPDGSLEGVPLPREWATLWLGEWHRAQYSVTFPGYPGQDVEETQAAHRYRMRRDAAHVDGLHLENGRRILREPHAFILGIAPTTVQDSPLVIWEGSEALMAAALEGTRPGDDVTDAYKAARQEAFDTLERREVRLVGGEAVLLHRLALHGIAPWGQGGQDPRPMVYFRPLMDRPEGWASL